MEYKDGAMETSRKPLSSSNTIVAGFLTSDPTCTDHQDDFKARKLPFNLASNMEEQTVACFLTSF